MAAMYFVYFSDGKVETVYSADCKSSRKRDIRASYIKARKKGEAKHAKINPQARATEVRCVG
jgi:hypothetical protein